MAWDRVWAKVFDFPALRETGSHPRSRLDKEDCMMRKTMTILSKRMLFLDGDHLDKEDFQYFQFQ